MTREEERHQAASNYALHFPKDYVKEQDYIAGAEWADMTMIERVCKYLKTLTYQEFPGGPMMQMIDDTEIEKLKAAVKN